MEVKHLLIACSGSVATIKLNELIEQFLENQNDFKFEVKVF